MQKKVLRNNDSFLAFNTSLAYQQLQYLGI
jgi:hypothetical protein